MKCDEKENLNTKEGPSKVFWAFRDEFSWESAVRTILGTFENTPHVERPYPGYIGLHFEAVRRAGPGDRRWNFKNFSQSEDFYALREGRKSEAASPVLYMQSCEASG